MVNISTTQRWQRALAPAACLLVLATAALMSAVASHADSARAFCVLSWHNRNKASEQGPCLWSQRQGNATIRFQNQTFDFPAADEGKTFTRVNRDGREAGPVFTRQGRYTLSVYWRQPKPDKGGW